MPFPFSRSKKPSYGTGSSIDPPPLYAQPSCTSSDHPPLPSQHKPAIRPCTHKAITSDVFAGITYHKEQQAAAQARGRVEGVETGEEAQSERPNTSIERPCTPPQGSRSIPWESYRDLSVEHPVFLYPDDVREKMHAKRIDPVVRAQMDKAYLKKMYGQKDGQNRKWYTQAIMSVAASVGTVNAGATPSFAMGGNQLC